MGSNPTTTANAEVAELADAPASKPGDYGREGSIPSFGTTLPSIHPTGNYPSG